MKKSSFKLYQILIIPFALMVSFVIAITGYFTWNYSESFAINSGEKINKQAITSVKTEVDYYFHHAALENNGLKRVISHELLDIYDHHATFTYIQEILDPELTEGVVDNLHIGYPNGDYLGAGNSNNGTLKRVANESTAHAFELIELKTSTILEQKENYYVHQTDWYQDARVSKSPIWSKVYPIFGTHHLGMTLSESVYDEHGNFVCVIGSDILLNELNKHINELTPTDNAYLFILDKQHNIIAQSGSHDYPNGKQLLTVKESDNVLLKQAFKYFSQLNTELPVFEIAEFTLDDVTEKYLISYIPYGREYGLDWHVGVVVPESDLFGHVRTVELRTFSIWLVAFIVCLIVGFLISNFINYSIQHLSEKVANINKTGSMFEHSNSSIQEVNGLSIAFSKMSHQVLELFLDLQRSNESLEKVVKIKTNELKIANQQLNTLDKTNKLTQLLSCYELKVIMRRYWLALESIAITSITSIIIDLDYCKEYNDAYSHIVGDECLVRFSRVISNLTGEKGEVIRLDCKEFVIIIPNLTLASSELLAQQLMDELAEIAIPYEGSSVTNYVTASMGIHKINKETMTTYDEMIKHVNIAMCQAKNRGGNQYVVSKLAD